MLSQGPAAVATGAEVMALAMMGEATKAAARREVTVSRVEEGEVAM